MERIAMLVAGSPNSGSTRRAFHLAETLAAQGHTVTLGLLEDGVLAGVSDRSGLPVGACQAILVLADDLELRGFGAGSLRPGCQTCDYGDLVDLMMERTDRTLGVL